MFLKAMNHTVVELVIYSIICKSITNICIIQHIKQCIECSNDSVHPVFALKSKITLALRASNPKNLLTRLFSSQIHIGWSRENIHRRKRVTFLNYFLISVLCNWFPKWDLLKNNHLFTSTHLNKLFGVVSMILKAILSRKFCS